MTDAAITDAAIADSAITDSRVQSKVVVEPDEFKFVKYDATEIAAVVSDLAARIGIVNPIKVVVDETTPMAAMSSTIDGTSSDALITIHVESGALEDTKHFTHFNRHHAEISLGRMLLRAGDRLRADFADAPNDESLGLQDEASWNTYVNGRLERLGVESNRQRWRYNFRNRFGFSDTADERFDRLWDATDLAWSDLTTP
jgi:hypothetical protein